MHRKTAAQQLSGGLTTAPLSAQQFFYDLNGRQIQEQHATGFQATAPYTPTGWLTDQTSYTPTGKTASTTDPLGHVTRTTYDALDRSLRVMDAAGRVTASVYDLAGQLLQERRAVGTPLEQAFATYAYTPNGNKAYVADALWPGSGTSHLLQYAYDGFDRLQTTTYADNTTERSVFDPNGNVTTWTNRAGLQIQRVFDALNRKTSEIGNTNGVPNQTVAAWNISNRSFSYDLAGRILTANNTTWSESSTYDAAGRLSTFTNPLGTFTHGWDASGNLASTVYGNGFQAGYGYDGLNRLATATVKRTTDPSPIALASLGYDPLSRRTSVSFTADGSQMSYAYDNADRLMSISHSFAAPANDVSETATYDPSGKRMSDTFSDPALQWTTNLAAAPQALAFNYDEFDQLGQVGSTATTYGLYTPNALGRSVQRVAVEQGGTDGLAYMTGDGVHTEDVTDSLYQRPNGTTTWTALGQRSYVPGTSPDERLAFIDTDGTIRIPHPNMIGTLAALSQAGNPVLKLATGPWGESTATVGAGTGASAYPYRYTGQRQDVFANLYDYKARSYMPGIGRFLQKDPSGETDGPNLYAYVGNDPINTLDPTGMDSYVVARPVNLSLGFGSHTFIVTNASYLGDPNAKILDWGPSGPKGQYAGEVPATSVTRQDDISAWMRGNGLGFSAQPINAPDAIVDAFAQAVDYGGRNYQFLGLGDNSANSNAAPASVAMASENLVHAAAGEPTNSSAMQREPSASGFLPGAGNAVGGQSSAVTFPSLAGKSFSFNITQTGSRLTHRVTCSVDKYGHATCS